MKLFIVLIFLITFLVFIGFITAKLNKINAERFKNQIKDEIHNEILNSSFDICKECYYKKRCKEFEKEDSNKNK